MDIQSWQQQLKEGVAHLARDDALRPYTLLFPLPTITPHENYYQELVESIISQQLSVKAAATITSRFVESFGGIFPSPEAIAGKNIEELRSVGLSGQKATYITDLAHHVIDGRLHFSGITDMSNEEIVAMLTDVKGIGEWTAHMFLIFSLGRLNVLAHGDLGVRNGIQALYGFGHSPTPAEVIELSKQKQWHPYESLACWYIWKSLDNEPVR